MELPDAVTSLLAEDGQRQSTLHDVVDRWEDAERLRSLGLYEGARVGIVDTRSGMVLDVRGARLGLGWKVVAGITVQPLGA